MLLIRSPAFKLPTWLLSGLKSLISVDLLWLYQKGKWEKIIHFGKFHFIRGYLSSLMPKFWNTNLSLFALSWILYVDFTVRWPPEMRAAADFRQRGQSYKYKVTSRCKVMKKICRYEIAIFFYQTNLWWSSLLKF